MATPQSNGRKFEEELAEEFGLQQVPASGSVWHSKLDLSGFNFRWSLKFTEQDKFPITFRDIQDAIEKCLGNGADGSRLIMAARCPLGDFIIMEKEDFKQLQAGNLKIIEQERPQVAARKARARQPELLRDDGNN